MRIACLASACFVLLSGTVAFGQYWGGAVVNRASTAEEGMARGMADVIRSRGVNNLMTSEAAINVETARSAYLDNRLKATETYFQNRQLNRQYREAERGPRITQQQAERIARERAPKRATAQDVDPITGGLAWPRLLTDEQYKPYREKLDKLFQERATQGGAVGLNNFREIQATVDEFLAALRANISQYPSGDYMEARRFVERLGTEARYATS